MSGVVACAHRNLDSESPGILGNNIVELGLVFYLSARVAKVAPTTAAGLFMLYARTYRCNLIRNPVDLYRCFNNLDLHHHRRNVRHHGGLRHTYEAKSRGVGPIFLHGFDWSNPGVSGGDILAE